jgi:hypothetical protein
MTRKTKPDATELQLCDNSAMGDVVLTGERAALYRRYEAAVVRYRAVAAEHEKARAEYEAATMVRRASVEKGAAS